MRKTFLPAALGATLLLGGCTGLGGVLGPVLGGGYGGYDERSLSRFERAGAEACAREASRYGRVQVTDVRQTDRDYVEVRGLIDTRDRRNDEFRCLFRSDGRIADFRVG